MTDVGRKPSPGQRLTTSGKRFAARVVPADRRVKGLGGAQGRRRLQARKLVAPLLQFPVVLTTATGLKLRVGADPVDEQIAQHLLGPNRREYFPEWPGTTPDGACILDIGAHHGMYAAAALHTYPASHVICVEPSASALAALHANLAVNGFELRARVVNVALDSGPGEGTLRHSAEGSWGYSLHEDPAISTGEERVKLASLAEILDGARPEIVKCNAEGAEYSLFDQLETSDLRPRFMLVMVHPEFGDLERLLALAEKMQYRVSRFGTADRPALHMWSEAP